MLADDINYGEVGENAKFKNNQKSRKRNAFYKTLSREEASLPKEFQQVFNQYNLTTSFILRQDHKKKGRENCLFFSETVLRAGREGETECAKSYRGLISTPHFNKKTDYLVAFIPDACTSSVCTRVLDEDQDPNFSGSHIFMQADESLLSRTKVDDIWNKWGVKYRHD